MNIGPQLPQISTRHEKFNSNISYPQLILDTENSTLKHTHKLESIVQISEDIKPLSHLVNHAQEIADEFIKDWEDLVMTSGGFPAFICMSAQLYSNLNETLALQAMLGGDDDGEGEDFNATIEELGKEIFAPIKHL